MAAAAKAKPVKVFFDVISPFAFLCHQKLPSVLATAPGQPAIQPIPILFAGLLKHWGQLGPAEVSNKRGGGDYPHDDDDGDDDDDDDDDERW